MKKTIAACACALCAAAAFAADIAASIRIENVKPGKGTVYMAVYDSAEGMKKGKEYKKFEFEPSSSIITADVTVPEGFYCAMGYQDINGNEKLDSKPFGIPKEPVAITNYDGKGVPGGFDKQKARVDSSSPILFVSFVEF